MKILVSTILVFSVAIMGASQSRVVINNDAYITMSGGTAGTPIYLVVDNANTNAITTAGTGGNIVSEGEFNKVRWRIGTSTGSYTMPYYSQLNAAGMKIPYTLNITGAGVGGTHIDFSTYRTSGLGSGANAPLPSMVAHFLDAGTATVNNELFVVDRFWMVDATGYGTRPTTSMTIQYDNSAAEIASGNSLTESNLVAQRYNSTTDEWEGDPAMTQIYFGLGTLNTGSRTLGPFAVPANDFFETWVLVDRTMLLPVELLDMNVICNGVKNTIKWSTASETNNSHFLVERSTDGLNFSEIAQIQGAGNSSSQINYTYHDNDDVDGLVYYRLKQVDFDGEYSYSDVLVANCSEDGTDIITHYGNENSGTFLQIQSGTDQQGIINIYTVEGRLVNNSNHTLREGNNEVLLNTNAISAGIYMITLTTDDQTISRKVYLK